MTAPSCPEANALLAYASHCLDETAARDVEAHLDTCSRCMTLLVELVRFDAAESRARHPEQEEGEAEYARDGLFGKYRLESVVGRGAMGTVYAAHDRILDRRVAVKILRPHADAGGARERLTREARAMARLSHPNVVTVHDAGELDGRLYIAMELFSGATLASWLRRHDVDAEVPPAWPAALAILLRAGEGLSAAHSAGLVHRDFKPENVLLGPDGPGQRVVVTDFGLVASPAGESAEMVAAGAYEEAVDASLDVALTRTGVVVGTPRYMSAEQFRGGTVDARSDQFSFAATAYEALYRKPPFAGRTLEELRDAVERGVVELPPAETQVPPAVRPVLLRALATDPGARFASLAELLRALAAVRAPSVADEPFAPAQRGPLTKARVAAAAAAVAVVGLVSASAVVAGVTARQPPSGAAAASASAAASVPSASAALFVPGKPPRQVVLVAPLETGGTDARIATAVAAMLAADLGCSRSFDAFTEGAAGELAEDVGAPPGTTRAADIAAAAVRAGREVVRMTGSVSPPAAGRLAIVLSAADAGSGRARGTWHIDAAEDGRDLAGRVPELALRVRSALGEGSAPEASRPAFSSSLDALAAWGAGRESYAYGKWSEAHEEAAAAVAMDPAFQLARADDALALTADARGAEALPSLQAVVDHPDGVCERERLLVLGALSGLHDRFAASINAFQQYLSLWPADLTIQARVSYTQLDDGELPLALESARSAVADFPRAPSARAALVAALFFNGAFADVVREGDALRQTVDRAPEQVLLRLVASHALLDEDEAAMAVVHAQASYDPEIADEEEADLAMFRGRLDDAEAILRHRIAALLAENDGDVTYARTENVILAQLLVRRGNLAAAHSVARTALRGAAEEASNVMLYDLGQVFVATSDDAAAAGIANALAARRTLHDRTFARLLAGDRLRKRGKRDEAQAAYEDAMQLDDQWIVHERIGTLALERGDRKTAVRELSLCMQRKAEGVAYLEPGLHDLPPVAAALAKANANGTF